MNIQSNASPQEQNSPFYVKHEEFCQKFENFVIANNGSVKGNFNAWSYSIFGKIQTNYTWDIHYKRAVYGSTHSLLSIFYKEEGLFTNAVWKCSNVPQESSFVIRRKKILDGLNPKFTKLPEHQNYVIKSDGVQSQFTSKIINILQPLFESEEMYRIQLVKNELTIEVRSEELHLTILDKLINL